MTDKEAIKVLKSEDNAWEEYMEAGKVCEAIDVAVDVLEKRMIAEQIASAFASSERVIELISDLCTEIAHAVKIVTDVNGGE